MRWSRERVRGWELWRQPRRVVVYVLTINAVAVTVTTATAFLTPVHSVDLVRFGVLAVCAVVAVEGTRHIERQREYHRSPIVATVDTKAVVSFAAVIVLPPVLASGTVVLTYLLAWWRSWPQGRPVPAYRWVFSCGTVLCGTQAAVVVLALGMHQYPGVPDPAPLAGLADLGVIVAAAVLRWAINAGLVMAAIALSTPRVTAAELFSGFADQLLEAGAMGLGLVAAVILVGPQPLVLAGLVVALIALHRGLLLPQYQRASRTDAKTGLAEVRWWQQVAQSLFDATRVRGGALGLLIVDLDHFKEINDTYGHPNGDLVLRAIATELAAATRAQDTCGRWGGDEFCVVAPDIGGDHRLHQLGERIRHRVHAIAVDLPTGETVTGLTISVGGATYPAPGIDGLDALLLAADTALYRAKKAGRDRVQLSGMANRPPPPRRPESSDRPGEDTGSPH
ncbi:diguanylate cyclase (GGDEF) domain-containing protein [Amycolatopsis arida]|uniref:Diguanylate cyclase (GGDEF) domain-containing protein n=1 Tax=Amycolatopsis arida TaxID=587909 RepID=A0A1I5Q243_9PSEU|nr:GGDEF domain-containing protein [Amycolatopsis arida]SFP40259.1 diguanylate cyclase (GGDEF) domain-containing protein [Amycolatopsis arida]